MATTPGEGETGMANSHLALGSRASMHGAAKQREGKFGESVVY